MYDGINIEIICKHNNTKNDWKPFFEREKKMASSKSKIPKSKIT